MNYKYIPIDAVLYNLSLDIAPPFYNEHKFKEWAIRGYRKLNLKEKFAEKVSLIQIVEHKAQLPEDVKYINQIAYKDNFTVEDQSILNVLGLGDVEQTYINPQNWIQRLKKVGPWKPMKRSTNSFIYTVNLQNNIFPDLENIECCDHEYTIDQGLCLTSTLRNGFIWISYLAYATDDKCRVLIPDDEDLKDAIGHYCMYRFWNAKVIGGDRLSIHERDWNLKQYEVLLAKASAKLNMPDSDGFENIMNITTRFLPRKNHARGFYSKLNQTERYIP
jgi:hypothetical protein